MRTLILGLGLLTSGCAGAGLLLKSPAESRCTETGLRGCPEMAEGLVAFVEGDKSKGEKLLAEGAAQNSPDELRQFADVVVMLGQIPGASQYAGPVIEVAEVLRSQAADGRTSDLLGKKGPDKARPRQSGSSAGSATAVSMDARRAGQVIMANAARRLPCAGEGGTGICTPTAIGPLVVTDVSFSPACGSGASLTSLPQGELPAGEVANWTLFAPTSAAAWPVVDGDWLVLRVDGDGKERCSVSWAGYVPGGE